MASREILDLATPKAFLPPRRLHLEVALYTTQKLVPAFEVAKFRTAAKVAKSRPSSCRFILRHWAILWRLIEALSLRRVDFFCQILELFWPNPRYFQKLIIPTLSNLVKMEQKQHEITLFLPMNGKFVNENDFKSVTLKKKKAIFYLHSGRTFLQI